MGNWKTDAKSIKWTSEGPTTYKVAAAEHLTRKTISLIHVHFTHFSFHMITSMKFVFTRSEDGCTSILVQTVGLGWFTFPQQEEI